MNWLKNKSFNLQKKHINIIKKKTLVKKKQLTKYRMVFLSK
jgi:hypothetical protein